MGLPGRFLRLYPSWSSSRVPGGDKPSRKLNIYSPAAMVGYFDELSAALAQGNDDPDRVTNIAAKYSMEVVGPVPENYV
jgi:hypothetical protein